MHYAQELYSQQPVHNSPGVWKSVSAQHPVEEEEDQQTDIEIAELNIDLWKGSYMPSVLSISQLLGVTYLVLLL